MKLSVVIVSHNTCKLLEQAMAALYKASEIIDNEFFVVDNGSTDGTLKMLQERFPQAALIHSDHFGNSANLQNEALRLCRGEYVLLVSADTICNTDSLEKLLAFMDTHEQVGGISPKMVSPMGNFIIESKHGIDKNWAAFLKVTGLYKLFPRSKAFFRKRYDWVTEFETAEMTSLNASCMMLRRSVLNNIGLFDERFVLFGHNIDLSYRIHQAGYKNYYYAHTFFIDHGHDTLPKLSWEYLRYFYGAMIIFAVKYMFKLPVVNLKPIGDLIPRQYEIER